MGSRPQIYIGLSNIEKIGVCMIAVAHVTLKYICLMSKQSMASAYATVTSYTVLNREQTNKSIDPPLPSPH